MIHKTSCHQQQHPCTLEKTTKCHNAKLCSDFAWTLVDKTSKCEKEALLSSCLDNGGYGQMQVGSKYSVCTKCVTSLHVHVSIFLALNVHRPYDLVTMETIFSTSITVTQHCQQQSYRMEEDTSIFLDVSVEDKEEQGNKFEGI